MGPKDGAGLDHSDKLLAAAHPSGRPLSDGPFNYHPARKRMVADLHWSPTLRTLLRSGQRPEGPNPVVKAGRALPVNLPRAVPPGAVSSVGVSAPEADGRPEDSQSVRTFWGGQDYEFWSPGASLLQTAESDLVTRAGAVNRQHSKLPATTSLSDNDGGDLQPRSLERVFLDSRIGDDIPCTGSEYSHATIVAYADQNVNGKF